MTDEQIIKALKCCRCTTIKDCGSCPFYCFNNCTSNLATETLDLINRQKAEIERFADIGKMYSEVRAEAIKEFAEMLTHTLVINNEENTEYFDFSYTLETIDNLVKEMIGEQE